MTPQRQQWDDEQIADEFARVWQALRRRPTEDTIVKRIDEANQGSSWNRSQIAVALITGLCALAGTLVLAYVTYKTQMPLPAPDPAK